MKNIIIIGNSAAGVAAAESIRTQDSKSKIVMVSDEPYFAYCRCLISNYLSGSIEEKKLTYRDEKFYSDNRIELLLDKKVERVDVKKKKIVLAEKQELLYDSLIIATGAHASMPKDLKGTNKRGAFGFRTIKDTNDILELLPMSHTSCVLGGGLIGLKAAYGLKKRGQDVKVVVRSGRILSQVADDKAAGLLLSRFQENGIEVLLNTGVSEIIGNGDVKAIKLENGKVIGTSIVVVGKGVTSNTKLVRDSDVKIDWGISVDEYMRTNIDNIYAAGDVAQGYDLTTNSSQVNALWPVAVEQGKIAGANVCGASLKSKGSFGMNSVEFFGLPLISMGVFEGDYETLVYYNKEKQVYRKLVIDKGRIIGTLLLGDIANSGLYFHLIKEKADISKIQDDLLDTNLSYARISDFVRQDEKIYI